MNHAPALASIAARLRRRGYAVVAVDGWQTRGHGEMNGITGLVLHHDASSPRQTESNGWRTIAYGHSTLAGPLAQFYLARSATIYLVAAGLCYHAGKVRSALYQNPNALGIEAANNGVGEPWPVRQVAAYAALSQEILAEFRQPANRAAGHREVCSPVGRKIDPAGIDLERFRRDVAATSPVPPPAPVAQTQPFESPEDAMHQVTLPATALGRLEVVAVPIVGEAKSLGPKGECWVSLRASRNATLDHVVVAGPARAGHPGVFQEFRGEPLLAGQPRDIQLPPYAAQVEITYRSPDGPIAVLVEPIPAA